MPSITSQKMELQEQIVYNILNQHYLSNEQQRVQMVLSLARSATRFQSLKTLREWEEWTAKGLENLRSDNEDTGKETE